MRRHPTTRGAVAKGEHDVPAKAKPRLFPKLPTARVAAGIGAGLSVTIGLVAIVGWSLGLPDLTRFFSEPSAMQPITAMCAILAGTGVLQASRTRENGLRFRVLTLLVVTAAIQTLVEYVLGTDLGTDRLLFAASVENQPGRYLYSGRMAVPTAAAFLVISAALLLARARGRFAGLFLSACATAVLIMVLIALLGHLYMLAPLTGLLGFTQVALPEALALGSLSFGVLALRPGDGWVRLLIGTSVGATAARWLLPIIVVVPIAGASLALRGSEVGLYPSDFRLAFTTAVTIVLLAGLVLWGAWQLDRSVAERRSAEALRDSEERQAFLLQFSDALRGEPDDDGVAHCALRMLQQHMRLDRCYITYYRPDDDSADFRYQVGNDRVLPLPDTVRLSNFPQAYEQVLNQTFVVEDDFGQVSLSDAERAGREALGMRAMVASTIRTGGRHPLCSMTAVSSKPRHWRAAEIALVEEAAERTWAAIERVRGEAALRLSEERFRQFADATTDVMWIVDARTGELEFLSPSFERVWGLPRSTVMNDLSRWADTLHPDDRARVLGALPQALAGRPTLEEYRIIRTDGEVRHIADAGFPIFDVDGRVVRVGGIAQDLTEKRLVEEALQSSEVRQRMLIEGIPQMVWRAIEEGRWTWASPQWTEFTGQAEGESHGWGWLRPVHPDDRDRARSAWEGAADRGAFHADYRLWCVGDQRHRWVQTRALPVRTDGRDTIEWLGTSTDVDDIRALQERQQVLVAELQHRTFNLLGMIRSTADATMRSSTGLEDFGLKFHDRIAALARVQRLLSRLEDNDRITFDELVRNELEAIGALPNDDPRVTVTGTNGIAVRSGTVQILAMGLHELATNAVKYGALSQPDARLAISWRLEADHQLRVDWIESGVSMPPAGTIQGTGQGRELIEDALPYQLRAKTTYDMTRDGVHCSITFAVSSRA